MDSHVLVIGATLLDVKGKPSAGIETGMSNPGTIRFARGGTARNVAENLARLGADVVLISAIGDDLNGQRLMSQTAEVGVDVEYVLRVKDKHTGAYIALLENDGSLGTALDDVAVMTAGDIAKIIAATLVITSLRQLMGATHVTETDGLAADRAIAALEGHRGVAREREHSSESRLVGRIGLDEELANLALGEATLRTVGAGDRSICFFLCHCRAQRWSGDRCRPILGVNEYHRRESSSDSEAQRVAA